MAAVTDNHVASFNAQRSVTASSFGAWLQGLSSGLNIAGDLNTVLDEILRDAPAARADALSPQAEALMARQQLHMAERRILELESELTRMRELVREDQLTGSLNRRGLDDVLERELARAGRQKSPLCVALLDLDDFKKLNDTYGHCAGDAALIHLVRVVKETLRKMDVIARFGGEEFMIVLPDTPLENGLHTLNRVQAELTGRVFMHDNERVFVTFSAGITLCNPGEEQAALIARADQALYKAKQAGKNRVISAD